MSDITASHAEPMVLASEFDSVERHLREVQQMCADLRRERDQDRATLNALHRLTHSDEAVLFRHQAHKHIVDQPYADNRYIRLLDDVRALVGDVS